MILKKIATDKDIESWNNDGFLYIKGDEIFDAQARKRIISEVDDMDSWVDQIGKSFFYYEENIDSSRGKILNRVEYFLDYSKYLNSIFRGEEFVSFISSLCGQSLVLYKEKVNFKYPNASGFEPHQDAQAGWGQHGHTFHMTIGISIDPSNKQNGALELARDKHRNGLIGDMFKPISPEVVNSLHWEMFETDPLDIIIFDSYTPHRSSENVSNNRRRMLFLTYNYASEGDVREKYFNDKRKSFPPDIERDGNTNYSYKI
ncbi:phytanoyl-CoA dioxygenase family protein [Porticoccaceae bacterium]|nr:phytanoyl-CoA dioxygenase family protein [Porticoccaceae bacterium]MDB2319340.1 phytanoyl-CoA dioxygenase family protein [Porticoccaceae bacterium]